MSSFFLILLIALAVYCLCSKKTGRTAGGHAHGGNRAHVARHEAGHVVAARAVGGRVRSAALTSGRHPSGLVQTAGLPNAKAAIVFLAAGRIAAGGNGCSDDDAAIRRTLREFPSQQRAQVRRDCERQARQIVSSRKSEIRTIAAQLDEKGRL